MARGKKDSNKPKGRTTAYAYFLQSEREAMRAGNKENGKDVAQNIAELSRFCSEKWKCLDDAKKAPFYELAEADKRRYDQEMANYNPTEDEETPKKSRKRKRQDDENHPKRNNSRVFEVECKDVSISVTGRVCGYGGGPRSAYLFFCEEERPKVKESQPGLTMTEVSKTLGALWSTLDQKRKEKFVKLAKEDKERYVKEMEEYKHNSSESGPSSKKH